MTMHAPQDTTLAPEEMVALAEFLSERLPQLRDEWQRHRDQLRASGTLPTPGG